MDFQRRALWVVVLAGLTLVGGSCGGGGGSGDGPVTRNDLFAGSYQYAGLAALLSVSELRAGLGVVTSDGAGTITFRSNWAVQAGTWVGPTTPDPIAYSVDASRSMTIADNAGTTLRGRVADDGSVAALTTRQAGTNPRWVVYMRRDTTPSLAALAGTWRFMEWSRASLGTHVSRSAVGVATADASGGFHISTTTVNYDGDVDPVIVFPTTQQAAIEPDGSLAFHQPPAGAVYLRGSVSADGSLILLGGEFSNHELARVRVMVRETAGASQAALDGSYGMYGWYGFVLAGIGALWGAESLDGMGGGVWRNSTHTGPDVLDAAALALSYTVASDGTSFLGLDDGTTFMGALGGGGKWAFYGGATSPGSPTILFVLIR